MLSGSEDRALTAHPTPSEGRTPTEADTWQQLLELAAGRQPEPPDPLRASPAGASVLLDLYLPLCRPARQGSRIVGHLGQSIDGYVATASGDSDFVNDPENIRHLHRLRALHDAVIVGAGTIAADDPRLTTRRVPGPNPVRVVLDPRRRLPAARQVFSDGAATTLLIAAEAAGGAPSHGQAEVLFVPARDGAFDLAALVERLAALGLRKLFVEGGGTTVSRFFDAGLLDRLQIAIAPVFTGRGRPGLRLKANASMRDCPRPEHRVFAMGRDFLFDCDLRPNGNDPAVEAGGRGHDEPEPIRRIR